MGTIIKRLSHLDFLAFLNIFQYGKMIIALARITPRNSAIPIEGNIVFPLPPNHQNVKSESIIPLTVGPLMREGQRIISLFYPEFPIANPSRPV